MLKRRMKFQVTNTTRRVKKNIPETGHSAAVTSEHTQQQTEKNEEIINGAPNDGGTCGKFAPEMPLESDCPEIEFVASHNAEHLDSDSPEIEFVGCHNAEYSDSDSPEIEFVPSHNAEYLDSGSPEIEFVASHNAEHVDSDSPEIEFVASHNAEHSDSDSPEIEFVASHNAEYLESLWTKFQPVTGDTCTEVNDHEPEFVVNIQPAVESMSDDTNFENIDLNSEFMVSIQQRNELITLDSSMERNPDSPQCVPSDVPEDEATKDNSLCPVLIVGPNGEVAIDEKSLYIPQTVTEEPEEKVIEKRKPPRWTKSDMNLFYRTLKCVGINFEAMAVKMEKFTRSEIKAKFRKESRRNPGAIQKIMREAHETKLQVITHELQD